jgi:hypothetical protein
MPAETAAELFLLPQSPPAAPSVSETCACKQTLPGPLITPAYGWGLTVMDLVTTAVPHRLVTEYEIEATPAEMALTTPDSEPTEPIPAAPELQMPPPEVVSRNVTESPTQTLPAPVMGRGSGLMLIIFVALQPVGIV